MKWGAIDAFIIILVNCHEPYKWKNVILLKQKLIMKKYLFIFALILISFTSNSQVLISLLLGDKLNSDGLEFGLEGGINYTNISGFESSKMSSNFNLGFYFDIRMKNQLYLNTGVSVKSSFGFKDPTDNDLLFLQPGLLDPYREGDYKQKIKSFHVPILMNYKFKNHIYAELGPQLGWARKGWVEYESENDERDINEKHYNSDMIARIDVGAMAGLGYKLRKGEGLTVGIRYYRGFIDVFKDKSGTKNNSINLKINIPIGAGKTETKE